MTRTDHTLQLFLDLDGLNFVYDGGYWIKYAVSVVKRSPDRPHGIKYSLTLHDRHGARILGIDNVHPPKMRGGPARKSGHPTTVDHLHRGGRVYGYEFKDAETLLSNFDKGVIAELN